MRMRTVVRSLLVALFLLFISAPSFGQVDVGISVSFGPPPIPVYAQPVCPGDNYIWVPGYWAWDPDGGDYYWVPGTWVLAPQVGYLWTPGWWGWSGAAYIWHPGYWGPHVGFYGGIDYGFGYFGNGYAGGRWDGGRFFYNREVTHVNVTVVHNVYNEKIVNNYSTSRVSYNGGRGGLDARPTSEEESYDRERHIGPVAAQTQHVEEARNNTQLRASYNHGKPPIAATQRPNEFSGSGVVKAKEAGGSYEPPPNRGSGNTKAEENNASRAVHPSDLPPVEHMTPPNTGNTKLDQKYQQQQEKLYQQQEKDRQKLAAQQEKEHQQMQQRNSSEAEKQQMEQRHQQQTQQMYQQHAQQRQNLQQKQQPHEQSHEQPHEQKPH